MVEASAQLGFVILLKKFSQRGAIILVGIVRDPLLHLCGENWVHRAGSSWDSSAPSLVDAVCPVSRTSK
jgi:hypothetical protein